jgi:Xaa-Pro aminopeptidase
VYQDYAQSLTCRGYQAINFVGHGLGMSLHEEPFIDRYGDNVLQKDMTLCIEPICIVEGRYGFQLENEIVLTEEGCRMITGGDRTYRKLPVLGL